MGVDKEDYEAMVQACTVKGIDRTTCGSLVNILDKLDDNQEYLWRLADNIEKVSKNEWEKLDKAYNKIGDAKDWIVEIIGTVD